MSGWIQHVHHLRKNFTSDDAPASTCVNNGQSFGIKGFVSGFTGAAWKDLD